MNRLDHSAVVKCFQVPNELQGPEGELPMLCMEYCTGGDLRKVSHIHFLIFKSKLLYIFYVAFELSLSDKFFINFVVN